MTFNIKILLAWGYVILYTGYLYFRWLDRIKNKTDQLAKYWIEVDKETKNPTGNICWSYYQYDKPLIGNWIEVIQTRKVSWEK